MAYCSLKTQREAGYTHLKYAADQLYECCQE